MIRSYAVIIKKLLIQEIGIKRCLHFAGKFSLTAKQLRKDFLGKSPHFHDESWDVPLFREFVRIPFPECVLSFFSSWESSVLFFLQPLLKSHGLLGKLYKIS